MKACVISMLKDENLILEHFCKYYDRLFGYENIYIMDNGSSGVALSKLHDLHRAGWNIDFGNAAPEDYNRKGDLIGGTINMMLDSYDVFIVVDCDEFLGVETPRGYSFAREDIFSELSRFRKGMGYRITNIFRNNPFVENMFSRHPFPLPKLVFGNTKVEGLTVGSHGCHAPSLIADSSLIFIEFHNRPFADLQRSAREKLRLRLDLNDEKQLRSYRGKGEHLPQYLLFQSEAEYRESLDTLDWFALPSIGEVFREIGLPPLFA